MKSKKLFLFFSFIFWIGLFFLLGEFAIRIFKPQPTFYGRFHELTDFWPAGLFADSPGDVLPYSLTPGRYHVRNEKNNIDVQATINSLGYRGREFSIDNKEHNIRMLFVGSSVIFGFGVEDNQSLPVLLEEILRKNLKPRIEIINAGFQGYTSLSHYVYLRNFGMKLRPRIILLEVGVEEDLTDLLNHIIKSKDAQGRPTKVYDKYKVVSGIRVHRNYDMWLFKLPLLKHSQLYYFFMSKIISPLYDRIRYFKGAQNIPVSLDNQVKEWFKYVNFIKQLCEDNSVRLIAVVMGSKEFLEGKFSEEHKGMIAKLKENGIEFIDIASYMSSLNLKKGQLWFPHDGHLNLLGIKKSAKFIADYLMEDKKKEYLGAR